MNNISRKVKGYKYLVIVKVQGSLESVGFILREAGTIFHENTSNINYNILVWTKVMD